MKAIISSTYDPKYLYFIPICVWAWNRIGVDVICFMPYSDNENDMAKMGVIRDFLKQKECKFRRYGFHTAKDKEATYAQCSRLYGACLDLPEDEVLVTSDVDIFLFKNPMPDFGEWNDNEFKIFGADLVPEKQLPICYIGGSVKSWRNSFNIWYGAMSEEKNSLAEIRVKNYQQCLDELLGNIECDNMRGNYWAKDQEEAFNKISKTDSIGFKRAKEGTQFASKRYDRDEAYLLERLNPDTIDFHMPRPGYEEKNFEIILKVFQYHFPNDNFQWLIDYTNEFKKLL